ncbi:hypothetical protein SUGI_0538800 [Cryptomeria japonica]|nr:hypothetical protein SUGI_0538800 [Cryptomeria japonica]
MQREATLCSSVYTAPCSSPLDVVQQFTDFIGHSNIQLQCPIGLLSLQIIYSRFALRLPSCFETAAIDTGRKVDADKDEAARRRQPQGYSNRSSNSGMRHRTQQEFI